ncbi:MULTISPECIES: hypothetical protein [unclassified Streptomyces]|nr:MULTISPECIES: hypothetical protein [unclassified Streptomyces]MCX4880760.1 hypothetical protein [Streptomyces sp. NBC_00847]MCX5420750.1 hypothetical protein [Streptomyces sp. NBC_00078]
MADLAVGAPADSGDYGFGVTPNSTGLVGATPFGADGTTAKFGSNLSY